MKDGLLKLRRVLENSIGSAGSVFAIAVIIGIFITITTISAPPAIAQEERGAPRKGIEDLIPSSQLTGAEQNMSLTLDRHTGHDVKGGYLLNARGFVPFDMKREQVRPTLMAAIKGIKQTYPDCEWIVVWLHPDREMVSMKTNIGKGEYKEGKITLHYNIPSEKQMKEWNSLLRKPAADPKSGERKINDSPRLYRPDKKTFLKGKKILSLYHKYWKRHPRKDEQIYSWISRDLGLSVSEVKKYYRYMNKYYGHSGVWGTETVGH